MKKSTLIFLSLLLLSGLTLLARTFHAEAAAAWDSVQHLGAAPWAGVLMLSLLNYGLRFVRWHQTIRRLSGQAPPMLKHLLIYVAGFAFTTTPGKAGEALRGLALKPFGVEYRHSFAAFVWERLMDMLVVLALCSAVLLAFPAQTWLLALAAGLVGCLILVLRSPLSDRLMQGLQQRCPPDSRWARWTGQIRQTRRDTAALLRWAWAPGWRKGWACPMWCTAWARQCRWRRWSGSMPCPCWSAHCPSFPGDWAAPRRSWCWGSAPWAVRCPQQRQPPSSAA